MVFTIGFRSFSRWTFLLLCSYEYSSRALYEQQFGGHVEKLPPRLPVLVEVCYSSITSASSVPTPEVAMTPVLLSQHDLTRAFFQALGEELPQLVVGPGYSPIPEKLVARPDLIGSVCRLSQSSG